MQCLAVGLREVKITNERKMAKHVAFRSLLCDTAFIHSSSSEEHWVDHPDGNYSS